MSALAQKQTCAAHKPMSKSGHQPVLFDHLVGTVEQRRRDGDTERLSGLEVDHKLELGRLLHWKFGWLGTFEIRPA